jgi:6-phosphogluconolactonase (cycloisomerase 2 family)
VDAPALPPGTVYTESNDASANEVFAYSRGSDGNLAPLGVFATAGTGTGGGLGNSGALAVSPARQVLLAVNAGDSSVSMFEIHADGSLLLVSKIASGGVSPISVTVAGDIVYVVNAGNAATATAANISGFQIDDVGLAPIPGSTQPLSAANPAPAQIAFTPDGTRLVVTEKATNKIDTYVVTAGVASAPAAQASAGKTPFGVAFDGAGHLIVSEAAGGADGGSTASSYTMASDGELTPVSSAVPSAQSAACWVVVVGSHAYAANTHSNNLSSYAIAATGALTLLDGAAVATGTAPIDVAATPAGAFLYAIDAGAQAISWSDVEADGTLVQQPDITGIPPHATGLVAL